MVCVPGFVLSGQVVDQVLLMVCVCTWICSERAVS